MDEKGDNFVLFCFLSWKQVIPSVSSPTKRLFRLNPTYRRGETHENRCRKNILSPCIHLVFMVYNNIMYSGLGIIYVLFMKSAFIGWGGVTFDRLIFISSDVPMCTRLFGQIHTEWLQQYISLVLVHIYRRNQCYINHKP